MYACNVTLKNVPQSDVAAFCKGPIGKGDAFYIAPTVNDYTVFASRECGQTLSEVWNLARAAPQHFACHALAYLNWDNSITEYRLFHSGELVDSYQYNNDGIFSIPEGGNAALLCAVFEAGNVQSVEAVLRGRWYFEDDGTFDADEIAARDQFAASGGLLFAEETDRHEALARLLNLPPFVTWFNYEDVEATPDEADDIDKSRVIHLP